jgi:YbbR domain-containing protein
VASVLRRITNNWKLKVLAFVLAVLLWGVVSAEQVTTSWVWVPLEVEVRDPTFQAVPGVAPLEVEVRFTGPGRDLLDVAVRRPPLRLVLDQIDGEAGTFVLDPRMVQVPRQLAVNALDVRPSLVQLSFAQIDTRAVPVRVRVANRLGPEWAVLDTVRADPTTIVISGPPARVAATDQVFTLPVELTPRDTLFTEVVAIDTTGLSGMGLSIREVRVTALIDRIVERTVSGVPIDIGPGVGVTPQQVTVHLRGPQRALSAVRAGDFRVVVSIGEIPAQIPPEGAVVPLRLDRLRPDVQGTIEPQAARLFPVGPAQDTIPAPRLVPSPDTLIVTPVPVPPAPPEPDPE